MPKVKREYTTEIFQRGTVNTVGAELIKKGAASNSRNFITKLDRIELSRGRKLIGAEESGNDPVLGLHTAYRQDGTEVKFRKIGTNLQYLNSSDVWTDIKTDLTDGEELSFAMSLLPPATWSLSARSTAFSKYTPPIPPPLLT